MKIKDDIIDELLEQHQPGEDLFGSEGLVSKLTKRLMERILEAEMSNHLGYERGDRTTAGKSGNTRNGRSPKRVKTLHGELQLDVPRDRDSSFEPQIVRKHQRRLKGFDDRVLSLYSRGMTVREIQGHLEELYQVEVSPDLISQATHAVWEDIQAWRNRPLQAVWPIVYLDALVVRVRHEGVVTRKSVYLAIGVNLDGTKEALGLWIEENEGARFWLKVVTELKNRGVEDMLIVCCDGLKGFPEAIEAVFEKTVVQLCIVHMIRSSTRFVAYKDRKAVCAALKPIYTAPSREAAEAALEAFDSEWGERYPIITQSWMEHWERLVPFLDFPEEIRRAIYTTNAIESINSQIRKYIKNRGHFPDDKSALKLIYLALRNAEKKWTMPIRNWKLALNQLAIKFEGRLPL